jgi:hypothetical protein
MSGSVAERKRLLHVTEGNIRQSHLYINGHYDFFPADSFGTPRKSENQKTKEIEIYLVGLNETIKTDISSNAKTGKPRGFFRGRKWVRSFYEYHKIHVGDVLALERIEKHRYRLYPFDLKDNRESNWGVFIDEPMKGKGPTVIELFAGCGGMLLGFEKAGFQTILANEWDAAACETIRRNLTHRVAQCAVQEIETFPLADVVVGGPPCQGFSNLGERLPNDPRRQLWRHFLRAVKDAKPYVFSVQV